MRRLGCVGALAIALGLLAGGCGTSTATPNTVARPPTTTTSLQAASTFTSWCHLKVGSHWGAPLRQAYYTVGPATFDRVRIPRRDTLQAWKVGPATLIEVSKLVDSRVPLLETGAIALIARGISSTALGCATYRGRI